MTVRGNAITARHKSRKLPKEKDTEDGEGPGNEPGHENGEDTPSEAGEGTIDGTDQTDGGANPDGEDPAHERDQGDEQTPGEGAHGGGDQDRGEQNGDETAPDEDNQTGVEASTGEASQGQDGGGQNSDAPDGVDEVDEHSTGENNQGQDNDGQDSNNPEMGGGVDEEHSTGDGNQGQDSGGDGADNLDGAGEVGEEDSTGENSQGHDSDNLDGVDEVDEENSAGEDNQGQDSGGQESNNPDGSDGVDEEDTPSEEVQDGEEAITEATNTTALEDSSSNPQPEQVFPELRDFIRIDYVIALPTQQQATGLRYLEDLKDSMDLLVAQIGSPPGVEIELPSVIDSIFETDCPPHIDPMDECKDVQALLALLSDQKSIPDFADEATQFEHELIHAVGNQELQKALDTVNPESKVYIVTGTQGAPADSGGVFGDGTSSDSGPAISHVETVGKEPPSVGAWIAMIAAGLCLALVVFAIFLHRRRRPVVVLKGKNDKDNSDRESTDIEDGRIPDSATSSSNEQSPYEYSRELNNMMDDVSSIASSALSFCNPGGPENPPSMLGVGDNRQIILPQGSRDMTELETAIRNGDWTTTGATAAILATHSSYDLSSIGAGSVRRNMHSTLNPARSAELDRWIEAGDWQEVLNATNRFENEDGSNQYLPTGLRANPTFGSNADDEIGSRVSYSSSKMSLVSIVESVHSALYSSGNRSLASSAKGDSVPVLPTGGSRKAEIKDEIEVLVRDVVPEEIDSVEELMIHFEGKEEELLFTLQTMQSRMSSQRARLARKPPSTISAPVSMPGIPAYLSGQPSALEPSASQSDCEDDSTVVSSEFGFEQALAASSAAAASSTLGHF